MFWILTWVMYPGVGIQPSTDSTDRYEDVWVSTTAISDGSGDWKATERPATDTLGWVPSATSIQSEEKVATHSMVPDCASAQLISCVRMTGRLSATGSTPLGSPTSDGTVVDHATSLPCGEICGSAT